MVHRNADGITLLRVNELILGSELIQSLRVDLEIDLFELDLWLRLNDRRVHSLGHWNLLWVLSIRPYSSRYSSGYSWMKDCVGRETGGGDPAAWRSREEPEGHWERLLP